ncbi:PaaD-like protein (DUF59) involved in Fe-S cluster assembly [Arcticibacter svalbardensis MN12-7]|uniref:PaaD-like protein (DUF59) involved in Fe-S cluster assembly n=1 Tax=Arcticibacter svalbardensis MN12-7 TaxID=1150600 RepID=R9GXB0_9SPHI|nr:metal-sulfur cluster assembly factor [Arcticibacter svalbardensis]EOR96452.1 PaaD-like protein (DUF59) involved in Fe-S cluster assembly [Arcticibacter svalbardensis MN12-7]
MKEFDIRDQSSFKELEIIENLRTVLDPELQINVIDMGLIYHIDLSEELRIRIEMTLSSSHCPMGEAILQSVKNCLEEAYPGYEVVVDLVWEPNWTYENITEEGRRQLGR